jgi:hypothetical protein
MKRINPFLLLSQLLPVNEDYYERFNKITNTSEVRIKKDCQEKQNLYWHWCLVQTSCRHHMIILHVNVPHILVGDSSSNGKLDSIVTSFQKKQLLRCDFSWLSQLKSASRESLPCQIRQILTSDSVIRRIPIASSKYHRFENFLSRNDESMWCYMSSSDVRLWTLHELPSVLY